MEDTQTALDEGRLKLGHVYRGGSSRIVPPTESGLPYAAINDRMIIRIRHGYVQFDSPTVAVGEEYPCVPFQDFLRWAERDVTDQTPEDRWNRPHDPNKEATR